MSRSAVPMAILDMLASADSSWRAILTAGLEAVADADSGYLTALSTDAFLPTEGRMFAAFAQPIDAVRYVLVGEGPYPRAASATGVCFMDGNVESLWSENGLSKQVNRATSLRNFMKMLLVADGQLQAEQSTGEAMVRVSIKTRAIGSLFIQTLADMQCNLTRHGFLLLNAALVYRPHVAPAKEAKAWQPFLRVVLEALAHHADLARGPLPTLVLWGKIAAQLDALPIHVRFPKEIAEHPYNLSFIGNRSMQALFGAMHLLKNFIVS